MKAVLQHFSAWVAFESGPINHSTDWGGNDREDGSWPSAWDACAVGCFSRASGYSQDELLLAMQDDDDWVPIWNILNNSHPATFEQLDTIIGMDVNKRRRVSHHFAKLTDCGL
jgi:hypothetical protein